MQKQLPKVSLVVASYNQEAYILQAYESALNQTYPNIEIIGFDNGSTDQTQAIIKSKYENHPRIRLFFNKSNEKLQDVSRKYIELCQGDFISILCGDDYYLLEKISLQMQCFDKLDSDYGVVYCPSYRLNQITKEIWLEKSLRESGFIFKKMMLGYHKQGTIPPISPLMRKECYEQFPLRRELATEGEDILLRFALGFRFHFLDVPLVVMRDHLNNQGKAILKNHPNFLHSMELLKEEPLLKKDEKKALQRYVGRHLRNYGWQGIRVASNPKWARARLREAIYWDKFQAFHPRTLVAFIASFAPAEFLKISSLPIRWLLNRKENAVLKADWK